MSGDSIAASDLEKQYGAFESAGLVVIYSCTALPPDAKRKLGALAAGRFFDVAALQLPLEHAGAARKVALLLRSMNPAERAENLDDA